MQWLRVLDLVCEVALIVDRDLVTDLKDVDELLIVACWNKHCNTILLKIGFQSFWANASVSREIVGHNQLRSVCSQGRPVTC